MSIDGLLLYPGAGTDSNHPSLVALDEALAPVVPVRRADFAYRRAGHKAPPRAPKLLPEVDAETDDFARSLGSATDRLVIGGRSMGGRMCSMAVAEGLAVAGLVLICYPLHPPGKPEKLRVDHFVDLDVPCLFVSGTKDPFGSPDEFAHHLPSIAGPVTTAWIEGKRHDLRNADDAVIDAVASWLDDLGA